MFTSLGLPRWNDQLGLYECEITTNRETSVIYDLTMEGLQKQKMDIIRENLQIGQEQLTKFPSLK